MFHNVLTWTGVAQLTSTRAFASAAKLLGQILGRHLCQQLLLVTATEHVDLRNGDWVQEALDHAEDTAEAPRCVDEVQLSESLRVVVLADSRSTLNVSVNLVHLHQTHTLEVHDCAAGLEQLTGFARASGQTGIGDLLVLNNEVLQHALVGGDFPHGFEVNVSVLLNVDWSAILVGFVVVLWVVGQQLLLLLVFECPHKVVHTTSKGLAPLLAFDEPIRGQSAVTPCLFPLLCLHLLGELNIELSSSQESQEGQSVESLGIPLRLQHHSQLLNLGILLFRGVAWVARLVLRCGRWEVVVIVLGVRLEVWVLCSHLFNFGASLTPISLWLPWLGGTWTWSSGKVVRSTPRGDYVGVEIGRGLELEQWDVGEIGLIVPYDYVESRRSDLFTGYEAVEGRSSREIDSG